MRFFRDNSVGFVPFMDKGAWYRPALKLLWRDTRSGELNLLIASLLLAVATVTCINLFTDRIQRSIKAQASTLLAADAQVRAAQPIPDTWRAHAQAIGLTTADILSFQAMAIADAGMQLASVKAVSSAYPLHGELAIAQAPYGTATLVAQGPPPGEAWLASRLFPALKLEVGDTLTIGNAHFKVSAALLREPDNSGRFFGAGTRVMIHLADVPQTGAVRVGSRVNYRWLLASEPAAVASFKNWLQPRLGHHFRWVSPGDANVGVGNAMARSEHFLLLAGSLGVVLAGAALALASRRYAARQKGTVALLKTLGMTPRQILRLYLCNIVLLGVATTLMGLLLGWLLHNVIVVLMSGLLPANLAPAGYTAWFSGIGVGLLVLLAFAAPPLLALRNVPPVSVLRSTPSELSALWQGVPGVIAVVALLLAYSQSLKLTIYITLGGLATIAGVGLLAQGLVHLCARAAKRLRRGYRLGFTNLSRHRRHNSVQIMLFSVLLMLLFVVYVFRTSMLEDWRNQLPPETPNHFAFNIFTSNKADIQAFFEKHHIPTSPFYPMVQGRLIKVNGEDADARARRLGSKPDDVRELNFAWAKELGVGNKVIAGRWWGASDSDEELLASLEQSYAALYKVSVGDRITVSLSGTQRTARVASIRAIEWERMLPNFYILFNQPLVDIRRANWLTSFYLAPDKQAFINKLGQRYPNVSLIVLDQIIRQIRAILEQVNRAVEFILMLIVGAAILVLVASIQATLDIRLHESALLRALGASRRLVFGSLLIEFSVMGWLAGTMGVIGAEISLYFLQTRAFDMPFSPHWELWLAGPLLGLILIGSLGVMSSASVVRVPPMSVLRKS